MATAPQVVEHVMEPASEQGLEMEPAPEQVLEMKPSVFISILKNKYPQMVKIVFYGLALLSVTTLSISQIKHYHSDAMLQNVEISNQNKTMKHELNERMEISDNCPSQFPLSEHLVASVCIDDRTNAIVDIRLFLNGTPTIKGISLSTAEYSALGQLYDSILFSMRNYGA